MNLIYFLFLSILMSINTFTKKYKVAQAMFLVLLEAIFKFFATFFFSQTDFPATEYPPNRTFCSFLDVLRQKEKEKKKLRGAERSALFFI